MSFFGLFGKHQLKALVNKLREATTLAVGTKQREALLNEVEASLNEENAKRPTVDDKRKLTAIRLLLDVLKTQGNVVAEKDLDTLENQRGLHERQIQKYRNLLRQSISETFANNAPSTVKMAKNTINTSLKNLRGMINEKYRNSATAKAKVAANRAAANAAAQAEVNAIIAKARGELPSNKRTNEIAARLASLRLKPNPTVNVNTLATRLAALRRYPPGSGSNGAGAAAAAEEEIRFENLDEQLKLLPNTPPGGRKGGRRTRKMRRRGKKGTRKH